MQSEYGKKSDAKAAADSLNNVVRVPDFGQALQTQALRFQIRLEHLPIVAALFGKDKAFTQQLLYRYFLFLRQWVVFCAEEKDVRRKAAECFPVWTNDFFIKQKDNVKCALV